MKSSLLLISFALLAGCTDVGPLTPSLVLSEGHSRCLSQALADELESARIAEVIPSTEACSLSNAKAVLSEGFRACPRHVTTVHFYRLQQPDRTDAIAQPGWLLSETPVRIARTVGNEFAVFTPSEAIAVQMDPQSCSTFQRNIRQRLKTHIEYGARVPPLPAQPRSQQRA